MIAFVCVCVCVCVHALVRVCVCQLVASFTSFGQLFRCARKRNVNDIMKVYIERNNMQVELIRFRKKIST